MALELEDISLNIQYNSCFSILRLCNQQFNSSPTNNCHLYARSYKTRLSGKGVFS